MRSAILATSSSAMPPTATTAEMAMQRSPAEPKPALTAASAARSRSASGSTTMWFFAPPSACTRLPARVPCLVHVARDRRGADERDRLARRGARAARSTATLSPCTTLNTPAGSPASAHSSREPVRRRRILLARLERPPRCRRAIAIGKNQHGTIAGKLNGLIIATTPSGWRIECTSTLGRDALGELALEQLRADRTRTRRPRARERPRPSRRSSTLPCSAVMIAASSSARASSSSRNRNRILVRSASEVERHSPNAARRGGDRGVDVVGDGERDLLGDPPGRGIVDVAGAAAASPPRASRRPSGERAERRSSSLQSRRDRRSVRYTAAMRDSRDRRDDARLRGHRRRRRGSRGSITPGGRFSQGRAGHPRARRGAGRARAAGS